MSMQPAVVLNNNARLVTPKLRKQLRSLLPAEDLYFSRTGWDAAIVNHFSDWKRTLHNRMLQRWAGGLLGYFFSTFTRTVPTEWRLQGKVRAEVINRAAITYADPISGEARSHATGEVLYRGPASIAGISTSPYYGFGMKAYPIAGLVPGTANLHIVAATIPETVGNLRKVWDGSYRSPNFHDFLVTSAEIRFNMARPFHLGGDAAGYHHSVAFELSAFTVNLIDMSRRAQLTAA